MGETLGLPCIGDVTPGDWYSIQLRISEIRQSINQIASVKLGPVADVKFENLTLDSLTAGSVLFAGADGLISQDNNNFFYDDENNRLGLGINTPDYPLHIRSGNSIGAGFQRNSNDQNGASLYFKKSRGTISEPDDVIVDTTITDLRAYAYWDGSYYNVATITMSMWNAPTGPTNLPSRISLFTRGDEDTDVVEIFRVDNVKRATIYGTTQSYLAGGNSYYSIKADDTYSTAITSTINLVDIGQVLWSQSNTYFDFSGDLAFRNGYGGTQLLKLSGTTVTIGAGTADTDYSLIIDGETNDFTATWMEDENLLDISAANLTTTGLGTFGTISVPNYITFDNENELTILGYQAGGSTPRENNILIGMQAGYKLASLGGTRNIYIGNRAGYGGATGNKGVENVGIGLESLFSLTTGLYNFAGGTATLYSNTTGSWNMALGYSALYYNTTGVDNVAVGTETLLSNSTGSRNTAIGVWAGNSCTSSDNIFIGFNAGKRQTSLGNRLIIDNQDRSSAANEITNCLIYGVFDATPANQTIRFNAAVTGTSYTSTVAIGTAPYACTSTTLNTNLNADLLDGQEGSYYAAASALADYVPYTGATTTVNLGSQNFRTTGTISGNYLGIGLTNPSYPVHIQTTDSLLGFERCSEDTSGAMFYGYKKRGTFAEPDAVHSGDVLARFQGYGWDDDFGGSGNYQSGSYIEIIANGTMANGEMPSSIIFGTRATGGSATERMRISPDGYVSINNQTLPTTPTSRFSVYDDSNPQIFIGRPADATDYAYFQLDGNGFLTLYVTGNSPATGKFIVNPTGGSMVIGVGAAGKDYSLIFDGDTDDGTITYDVSDNEFDFGDSNIYTTGYVYGSVLYGNYYYHSPDDADTGILFGDNNFYFIAGGYQRLKIKVGNIPDRAGVVINENADNADFRVEGQTDANLFRTDASADTAGFGVAAPEGKVEINSSADAQLLTLDQDHASAAFIDFQGTEQADDSGNISTGTPTGSTVKYIKHEIGGNAYWIKAETWS